MGSNHPLSKYLVICVLASYCSKSLNLKIYKFEIWFMYGSRGIIWAISHSKGNPRGKGWNTSTIPSNVVALGGAIVSSMSSPTIVGLKHEQGCSLVNQSSELHGNKSIGILDSYFALGSHT